MDRLDHLVASWAMFAAGSEVRCACGWFLLETGYNVSVRPSSGTPHDEAFRVLCPKCKTNYEVAEAA